MTQINPISLSLLILLSVIAAVIFLVFKFGKKYFIPPIKNRKQQRLLEVWALRLELLAWTFFIIFSIYKLFIASPYFSFVFLILILLAGQFFWKDFFPGLLFRLENKADLGDMLEYNASNCTIEAIGVRNIQLRNAEGQIIFLPYSHLGEAIITKSVQKSKLYQFSFSVNIGSEKSNDIVSLLARFIQECPWSIPSRNPIIKKLGAGEYEITSYATDELAANKQQVYIEERIKKSFS